MRETTEKHPSYATACLSHISCSPAASLFDSAIKHHNYLSLSIRKASRRRELNHDWVHPEEEIIEIIMSEQQFARFVSSVGRGEGVPVTISRFGGKLVEPCPEDETRLKFERELKADLSELAQKLKNFESSVKTFMEKKTALNKQEKEHLLDLAGSIRSSVTSTLPYVQDQFIEKMEKVVAEAKTVVEGHIERLIHAKGLEALVNKEKIVQLVDGNSPLLEEGTTILENEE